MLSLCSNLPNSLHRQFNSARKSRNIRQSMSRSTYVSHWTSLSILCLRTTSLLIKNIPTWLSCSSAFYKFLNVHCISIHLWHTQSVMRTMPDAQPREHFCSKLSLVKHAITSRNGQMNSVMRSVFNHCCFLPIDDLCKNLYRIGLWILARMWQWQWMS